MPALRVDWPKIRDTGTKGVSVNEPFVFVLPHGGRHLIMSIIDILKWRATYKTNDYDYHDWDELIAMVELTHLGLMEGEVVGDISDAIRYMADKLTENFPNVATNLDIPVGTSGGEEVSTITQTVNCGCGCAGSGSGSGSGSGVDYTIPPPDVPPTVNPPVTDPPLNPSNAQKCSMANYLVYVLRLTLLKVQESGGDYLSFSAWAETLFSSPVDFVYALTYQTWAWCKQWFTENDASVDSIFDEFVNTYVCVLFSATSAQEAHDSLIVNLYQTLIGNPDVSYTARLIAEELPYNLLFAESGAIDIPAGFASRACCGEVQESQPPAPDLPNGVTYKYWLLPMALDASAGTNDPNTTYMTHEGIIGNGIDAGALITRTSQQSNASMAITSTGFSRDYLNTRFGAVAGDWELAGYVFQTGARSQTPAMPLCTHSIQGSTNVLIAGTTALEPNGKYLISVPEQVGDEFTNSLTSQGYTVQRKADRNFSGGAGTYQPVITIRMTTKDGDYTGIRAEYRLFSAYMVIREKL